jgi:hypothetical protein
VLTVSCRLGGAHFSGGWSVDGMAGGWLIGAPATMVCESSAHGVLTVACRLSGAHFSGGWSVDGMAGGWLIGAPATMV